MAVLEAKFATMLPHLNERQWRVLLGVEARALGHGGVTRVARAARVSRTTVHAALAELDSACSAHGTEPPSWGWAQATTGG